MVSVTSFPQPPSYFQHAFSMQAHSGSIIVPILTVRDMMPAKGVTRVGVGIYLNEKQHLLYSISNTYGSFLGITF